MSSETDYPRQRTVAELLAEHGAGAPSGRRHRRRAADDDVPEATPDAVPAEPVPSNGALSKVTPAPAEPTAPATETPDAPPVDEPVPSWAAGASVFGAPASSPPRKVESPTEQFARITDEPGSDLGYGEIGHGEIGHGEIGHGEIRHTGPIDRLRRASPMWRDALEVVERTERELRATPQRQTRDDPGGDLFATGGPPTQAAAPVDVDPHDPDPDDADGPDLLLAAPAAPERADPDRSTEDPLDRGRPTPDWLDQTRAAPDWLDRGRPTPDLLDGEIPAQHRPGERPATSDPAADDLDPEFEHDAPPDEIDLEPRRRLGRSAATPAGSGRLTVLAQWVVGVLGGAALWIAFRFLWRNLPVVALAAAVLVTVGLVVLVRGVLHAEDRRSTVFAVLVGLLLTVSPALLVLLDR
jgi:hypothetical protein